MRFAVSNLICNNKADIMMQLKIRPRQTRASRTINLRRGSCTCPFFGSMQFLTHGLAHVAQAKPKNPGQSLELHGAQLERERGKQLERERERNMRERNVTETARERERET
jgi:hypothetical protein